MGIPKKAKTVPAKKPATSKLPKLDVIDNRPTAASVKERIDEMLLEFKSAANISVTQEELQAYAEVYAMHKAAEKALKHMKEVLVAKRVQPVEEGAYRLRVVGTPKINPQWKEEAIRLAEANANLKGEIFVESDFITGVQAKYPPNVSYGVEVSKNLDDSAGQ